MTPGKVSEHMMRKLNKVIPHLLDLAGLVHGAIRAPTLWMHHLFPTCHT